MERDLHQTSDRGEIEALRRRVAELEGELRIAGGRQRTEGELEKANALLAAQLETSAAGILVVDPEGKVVSYNRRFLELWSVPPEVAAEGSDDSLLGYVRSQLADWERFISRIEEIYAEPEAECQGDLIELRSGRVLSRNSHPVRLEDGTVIGRVWDFTDVTQLRTAEEQLRLTQYSVDRAADLLLWVDSAGRFFSVNEAACRGLGYSRAELLGRELPDIDPAPHPWPRRWQEMKQVGHKVSESSFRRRDGSWLPVEVTKNFLRFKDREYLCLFARDLTLRREAEAALRRSEALLRQVIDLVPHFIFVKDREGRFLLVNRAVAEAYGTTVEELLSQRDSDFASSAEEVRQFRADDLEVLESGRLKVIPEEQITDAQGRVRILQTTKIPVTFRDSDEPSVLGVAIDITELKRAEEERRRLEIQILHSQKLESLGVLAGGIAHDFNNLLGGILGNVGLALMNLDPDSLARPFLVELERATRRAAELANQMLAYSGKGKFLLEVIDLDQMVEEMVELLAASISKKARLVLELAEPAPRVEGDPTQLRQVAMNLVTNASDALGDESGTITVTTGVADVDRAYLRRTYLDDKLPRGPYAFFEIADTGCGMDEAAQGRIFDPFFTTKTTGRGLGMAAVLGIVRGHKGAIRVQSAPGKGSTFRVLFPSVEAAASVATAPAAEAPEHGEGTVLVVDDEEAIRFVAKSSLEHFGFEVVEAEDGPRALAIFARRGDGIDAVLLDMSMPTLDGVEVFHRLRRQRPDLPVIFSSGFSRQEAGERLVDEEPRVGFIQKPYMPQDLVRTVRRILAA